MSNEITRETLLAKWPTIQLKNDSIYIKDKKLSYEQMQDKLEDADFRITIEQLKELLHKEATDDNTVATTVYVKMPILDTANCDCDINEADHLVWSDIKFVKSDTSTFYVRDSDKANTYTRILSSASSSDGADAKILKEAFYNVAQSPERKVKEIVRRTSVKNMNSIPVTARSYVQIKADKYSDKKTVYKELITPAASSTELYKGFITLEGEFRQSGRHFINPPKNITNDPTEAALAYIDLASIPEGTHSDLWDNFLLERLHSPEYVSIFKAWVYSVAIGKNNSRQIMWLYGNGGTGKGCMCRALIHGFNQLTGKDLCLAASKDTGKSNFNSELLNKHLMVYADAKNLKSSMSEWWHNITGGDYVRIEGKCKEAISTQVYMKCLVCANDRPQCDMTDRSQSSRFVLLPFTLDDDEMKAKGLMDKNGQIIGSSDFEDHLKEGFMDFLSSCKAHYQKRCPTNSNIDAHEALSELESINLDSVRLIEEFIDDFFEITDDPKDRISQKEFRRHCLAGVAYMIDDDGVKPYKDINVDDVKDHLQKKYNFEWKVIRSANKLLKGVTSSKFGIRLAEPAPASLSYQASVEEPAPEPNQSADLDFDFDF